MSTQWAKSQSVPNPPKLYKFYQIGANRWFNWEKPIANSNILSKWGIHRVTPGNTKYAHKLRVAGKLTILKPAKFPINRWFYYGIGQLSRHATPNLQISQPRVRVRSRHVDLFVIMEDLWDPRNEDRIELELWRTNRRAIRTTEKSYVDCFWWWER